jgi:hypothetical protein
LNEIFNAAELPTFLRLFLAQQLGKMLAEKVGQILYGSISVKMFN